MGQRGLQCLPTPPAGPAALLNSQSQSPAKCTRESASLLPRPQLFPKASRFLEKSLGLFSCRNPGAQPKGEWGHVWIWGDPGDPPALPTLPGASGPEGRGEKRMNLGMCTEPRNALRKQTDSGVIREWGLYQLVTEECIGVHWKPVEEGQEEKAAQRSQA